MVWCHDYPIPVSLILIESLVATNFSIWLLWKFVRGAQSHTKLSPESPFKLRVAYLCLASIICNIISIFCFSGSASGCLLGDKSVTTYFVLIHFGFWWIGGIFALLFFKQRLHSVFLHTTYGYSKYTFGLLNLLCGITIIGGIIALSIASFDIQMAYLSTIIAVCAYIFQGTLTLWLFIYGLFQIQARSNSCDFFIDKTITKEDISSKQLILINTMSKYTVLVAICVFTTLITLIIISIQPVDKTDFVGTNNSILYYIEPAWIIIDMQINILCLLLQFSFFGKNKYEKYCIFCHNYCKELMVCFVVKDLEKQRSITFGLDGSGNNNNSNNDNDNHSPPSIRPRLFLGGVTTESVDTLSPTSPPISPQSDSQSVSIRDFEP